MLGADADVADMVEVVPVPSRSGCVVGAWAIVRENEWVGGRFGVGVDGDGLA